MSEKDYIIYKYDDRSTLLSPIIIETKTLNEDTTIPLIGRDYVGYGSAIASSFLWLMENFSSDTPPPNATQGQLWKRVPGENDLSEAIPALYVYDVAEPTNPTIPSEDPASIILGDWKPVSKDILNNLGSESDRYSTVYTSTLNAESIESDSLSVANIVATESITSNGTLFVNQESDLNSVKVGGDIKFTSDAPSLLPSDNGKNSIGSPGLRIGDYYGSNTNTNNLVVGESLSMEDGSRLLTDIIPTNDNDVNLGSASYTYNEIHSTTFYGDLEGTATRSRLGDLAERFEADAYYCAGTIVELGGDKEITKCVGENSPNVLGVISGAPGVCMNSCAGNDETHPYVAYSGRVPVAVDGPVRKGDRIVMSNVPGVGKRLDVDLSDAPVQSIIGRALVTKASNGIGNVMVVVGVK